MGTSWTDLFVETPWLGPLVWAVLHALDYYLTLLGAHSYHAGADRIVVFQGSYELNPTFQSDIDRRRIASPRFIASLLAMAAMLYWLASWAGWRGGNRSAFAFVMGMLIFTRVDVIAQHLNNIWIFRRINRPDSSIRGRIVYDRRTLYRLSSNQFASSGACCSSRPSSRPAPGSGGAWWGWACYGSRPSGSASGDGRTPPGPTRARRATGPEPGSDPVEARRPGTRLSRR